MLPGSVFDMTCVEVISSVLGGMDEAKVVETTTGAVVCSALVWGVVSWAVVCSTGVVVSTMGVVVSVSEKEVRTAMGKPGQYSLSRVAISALRTGGIIGRHIVNDIA